MTEVRYTAPGGGNFEVYCPRCGHKFQKYVPFNERIQFFCDGCIKERTQFFCDDCIEEMSD